MNITRRADGAGVPFKELFYMIHSMRSGYHDPRGLLWISAGRHDVVADPVPIVDIAPTILKAFGVPKPAYMRGEPLLPRAPQETRLARLQEGALAH